VFLRYPRLFDRGLGLEGFWARLSSCKGFVVCGASYPIGGLGAMVSFGFPSNGLGGVWGCIYRVDG
jgi:hypothetical protein